MVAGLLGPATNWRLPFLVMAAPTLLLAFLLLATVKEPPRGGKDCSGRAVLALQLCDLHGNVIVDLLLMMCSIMSSGGVWFWERNSLCTCLLNLHQYTLLPAGF
jgi:predicted MFS family arabinose efflux permease